MTPLSGSSPDPIQPDESGGGIFRAATSYTASEPLTQQKLLDTFAAIERADAAERERRSQPGYCPHQDVVLHPRDAARLDGMACPWCGRTLRSPGGAS